MTISDRIRDRRESLGLTQTDLALKMGLRAKSSVAELESKGDKVSLRSIEKVAKALNCSEAYLLGFENKPKESVADILIEETLAPLSIDYSKLSGNMKLIMDMCQGRTEEQLAYLRKLLEVAVSNMK